jgi:hypothetical protein
MSQVTEAIRKRFLGAIVVGWEGGTQSVMLPTDAGSENNRYDPFDCFDLVTGSRWCSGDPRNVEYIIRPGDKCEARNFPHEKWRSIVYKGWGGFSFAGFIEGVGTASFSYIRPATEE